MSFCPQNFTTPCYLLDLEEFYRSISGFRTALLKRFPNADIGYSVKTNSLPFLLHEANNQGCLAEVVSFDEWELAKLCGFSVDRIIYNGPMKSKDSFIKTICGGGIVNIETKRELQWLELLPKDGNYKVGLRLNINISHVSSEDADGDNDNSRFGFSDESGEFLSAIEFISTLPNVTLAGLHIHRTAHSRSTRFYRNSSLYTASIIKKYNLELDYIDIGGGFFGIFPNKPTFDDYATAIANGLKEYNDVRIIIEPGNALVASCFSFLTSVIDTKKVDNDTVFITTDGSRNDIDPFFRKSDYLKEIIRSDENRPSIGCQTIVGCSCLEYDRLFSICDDKELKVGDIILYKNVGAYTMTLSPLFIRYFPIVYTVDSERNIRIIRRPWTAHDLIRNDKSFWNE